jgi:hypothetical protein
MQNNATNKTAAAEAQSGMAVPKRRLKINFERKWVSHN